MTEPYESYAPSPPGLTSKQQVSQRFSNHSGGPKTKRGREVASRNAFKHGEAFDQFKPSLMADLVTDEPLPASHGVPTTLGRRIDGHAEPRNLACCCRPPSLAARAQPGHRVLGTAQGR